MGFFTDLWGFIVAPLYFAISAVLIGWHNVWSQIMPATSGASWVLSIIGLTLVIRAALIPLFVKQIKSSRNMQLIQPKVKELQKKFGHDRERLAQETMKLYKDSGTNPFASCLPILLQMPIFFTLFSLLNNAANEKPKGILSKDDATQFGEAKLFGSIKISDTFLKADGHVGTIALALFLVLAMTATTFLTQRQLMSKNMPKDALTGPYAQQQKLLLYVLPVVFAVGGIAFPIGVLFYWTTSNLWTMGQQFYVIRNNPAPGTEAERAKKERDKAKALKKGLVPAEEALPEPEPEKRPAQRQQPQRQPRSKRKAAAPKPVTDTATTATSKPASDPAPPADAAPTPSAANGQAITPKPKKNVPAKGVPNKNRKKR
ncbi:membrane protein insertase YidC [Nocardioides sp.]|uniref:membrane protein insertase YidC n=1 Tax=Nocardioides sp. TaxID=35761 RepID=UPI001A2D669D|nr:membrane protein insertase YidC [Nocardioides sp.]MBJ7359711.1 membrane protein insertase YidC [Nocardioides sp.]